MTKLPQVLVNVKFEKGTAPLGNLHVKEVIAQVEQDLAGQGRVLIRKSGTEPLIRVMVEGREQQQVQEFCRKNCCSSQNCQLITVAIFAVFSCEKGRGSLISRPLNTGSSHDTTQTIDSRQLEDEWQF